MLLLGAICIPQVLKALNTSFGHEIDLLPKKPAFLRVPVPQTPTGEKSAELNQSDPRKSFPQLSFLLSFSFKFRNLLKDQFDVWLSFFSRTFLVFLFYINTTLKLGCEPCKSGSPRCSFKDTQSTSLIIFKRLLSLLIHKQLVSDWS